MDLASYQRALMRMSFALEPSSEDLAALVARDDALLYRHMIRTRLLGMAKVAFAGCHQALGEAAFAAAFARYLAEAPPHSALIREVIADFAPFARTDRALVAEAPPFFADLMRFEEMKWRLAYALAASVDRAELRELDFTGAPVWNPLLACLVFAYPVQSYTGGTLSAEALELFMYRPSGTDEVRWYKADPFFFTLVQRSHESRSASLGELIPSVASEHALEVDQALLESLATSLTLAIERGVLWGVRE